MSQTESLAAQKASFDRRSVVKTAAWSVPVIAAAIAAPAAAASTPTGTVTVSFETLGTPVSYAGSPAMAGATPKSIKIVNSTSALINATATITITISPVAPAAAGVRIGKILGGTTATAGSWDSQNVITTTFNVPVNVKSGLSQTFDFDLTSYSHNASGNFKGTYNYAMNMAVLVAGKTATNGGSLTLHKA